MTEIVVPSFGFYGKFEGTKLLILSTNNLTFDSVVIVSIRSRERKCVDFMEEYMGRFLMIKEVIFLESFDYF